MTPEQAHFLQAHMQAIQPILPTPEKKWYDRLADSILGDDPGALMLSFTLLTLSASRREQVCARMLRVLPAQRTGRKQARVGANA